MLESVGAPLKVEDVELAPPGPGMVRVRLAASGVCHTDLSIQDGTLPALLPATLGHEGAGVVAEVGAGVDGLTVGDHVVLSWVAPCRRCRLCLAGRPELCEHGMDHAFAGPYGTTTAGVAVHCGLGTGTFAEETVLPAAAAVRIGTDLPLELAALIGCAVCTGVGAVVNAAGVRPGESVAVVGCGGVGLAVVQGARLAGAADIVAVDRVPAKLAMALDNGATAAVDASSVDPATAVRDLTRGGVDHALEVVGTSTTIAQAYAMARRGGTVTVVGAGRFDDAVSFPALGLMADAKRVQGTVYGGTDPARDIPRLVALASAGALDLERLVTTRIGLDDVDGAFRAMVAGEVARSLVVLGGAAP